MTSIYSNTDLQRKMAGIKDRLFSDGFYDSKVVARYKTETVVNTDPFKVNNTSVITDYVVTCIAEKNPEYINYGQTIETFNGDVRLTVRNTDKDLIINANELWLGIDITDNTIIYEDSNLKTFSKGINYAVNSRKPSVLGYDEIFVLRQVGKLNGEE